MDSAENVELQDQDPSFYLPLVEGRLIRLCNLLPGNAENDISVQIFIVELGHHPRFEALSYVWGDTADVSLITCNSKPLAVRKNLHNALKRLRYSDKNRMLWVDAICINQGSIRERSHHVAFMGLVYESADEVLVYMGNGPDRGATQVVSLIQDHKARSSNYSSLGDMPIIEDMDPIITDSRWRAVSTLLRGQWFSRAWVIQEVGLAKTAIAVYGKVEFNYRDFIRLMKWAIKCAGQLEARYDLLWWTIHHDWYDWSMPPDTSAARDLLVFLFQAKPMECIDPRDHIYAFLGHPLMHSEDGTPHFIPDYNKDVKKLYSEIAKHFLLDSENRILASVEHDEDSFSEGPTWVPRWDKNLIVSDFGVLPENWYRFSGDMKENQGSAVKINDGHLEIRGVLFDVVRKSFQFPAFTYGQAEKAELATPEFLRSSTNPDVLQHPLILDQALAQVQIGTVNHPSNGQNLIDAFSLTICAGRTGYSYQPAEKNMKQHRDNFSAYWKLRQSVLRPDDPIDYISGDPEEGDAEQFVLDFSQSCRARSFVITEKGYTGLGPWISRAGDICCFIPGSKVPFILRRCHDPKVQGGITCFRLVGEAYIHGLMRGEVLELIRKEDLEETAIVIL